MVRPHVRALEDNIIKMTILPKLIYKFQVICIKTQDDFITKIENLIQIFICNFKRPQNSQNNPARVEQS